MSTSPPHNAVVTSDASGSFTVFVGSDDYYSYINGAVATGSNNGTLLLEVGDAVAAAVKATAHVIFKVKWDKADHPRDWKGRFKDTPDHIDATEAGLGDVVITKTGKVFQVAKQTEKGVKVNPVDPKTGEVQDSYTVLGNMVEVALFDAAKEPGTIHAIKDLDPGTFIQHPNSGKRFKISKHGKWTTVYPVDDQGNESGKHTVLPPDTKVMVTKVAVTEDVSPQQVKQIQELKLEPKPEPPGETLLQRVKEWMEAEGKSDNYKSIVLDNYLTDEYIKVSGAAKGSDQSGGIKDLTIDEIAYALYQADWWEGDHPGAEEPPDPTEQQLTATRTAHKDLFSKLYGVQGGYATKLKNWETKNPQPPEILVQTRQMQAVGALIDKRVAEWGKELGIGGEGEEDGSGFPTEPAGPDFDHTVGTDDPEVIEAWLQNYPWGVPGEGGLDTAKLTKEIVAAKEQAKVELQQEFLQKAKGIAGAKSVPYEAPTLTASPSVNSHLEDAVAGLKAVESDQLGIGEGSFSIDYILKKLQADAGVYAPLSAGPSLPELVDHLLANHGVQATDHQKAVLVENLAMVHPDVLTDGQIDTRLKEAADEGDYDAIERELKLQRFTHAAWQAYISLYAQRDSPENRHAFYLSILQDPPDPKGEGVGDYKKRLQFAMDVLVEGPAVDVDHVLDKAVYEMEQPDTWDRHFAASLPRLANYAPGGSEWEQLSTEGLDPNTDVYHHIEILKKEPPVDIVGLKDWWQAADGLRQIHNPNHPTAQPDVYLELAASRVALARRDFMRRQRTSQLLAAVKAAKAKAAIVPDMGDMSPEDEQIPHKLPKPPKKYPPGVGKDTVLVVEWIGDEIGAEALKGQAKPTDPVQPPISTKARIKRVPADNLDAPGELVDYSAGIGSAIKMARTRSGPHERIIRRNLQRGLQIDEERDALKQKDRIMKELEEKGDENEVRTFYAVGINGIVNRYDFQLRMNKTYVPGPDGGYKDKLVPMMRSTPAAREPKATGWSRYYGGIQVARIIDEDDPVLVDALARQAAADAEKLKTHNWTQIPDWAHEPTTIDKAWVRENVLSKIAYEDVEIRQAHPEKYVPELRSEWDMNELTGHTTNEALKKLGKLGFREIRPRKNGNPKLINALGRRLQITTEDGKVTNVEALKPVYAGSSESSDELHDRLQEMLNKNMPVTLADPRNDPDPSARNSISKLMVFDMALGKQNGVEAPEAGVTPAGPKVKTDDEYAKEIVNEHAIKTLAEFEADIPLEALRVKARGTIIERFGMNDSEHWDFPSRMLEIPTATADGKPKGVEGEFPGGWFVDAKICTMVIAERTGVADAMLGESHLSDVEPTFSDDLVMSEGQNIYEAGSELAAELNKYAKNEPSALDGLDDKTRQFIVSQVDAKKKEATLETMEQQRAAQRTAKAAALRDQALKAEISKRRAEEGTVAAPVTTPGAQPANFHLPTWDTMELQPQTVHDIDDRIAKIEGPYDIPAFFTGGMLQDGVVQFSSNEAWSRVEVGFDQVVKDRLIQLGAEEAENSQNLEDILGSYSGSGKIYPGDMLILEEAAQKQLSGEPLLDALRYEARGWAEEQASANMASGGPVPEKLDAYNKAIDSAFMELPEADLHAEQIHDRIRENLQDAGIPDDDWDTLGYRLSKLETEGPTAAQSNALIKAEMKRVIKSYDYPDDILAKAYYMVDSIDPSITDGGSAFSALWKQWDGQWGMGAKAKKLMAELKVRTEQIAAKSSGLHRVEYVPHEQAGDLKPDSQGLTTGAPTSQRGQLRMYGFTTGEAIEFMKELGIVHDLEPEVPFTSLMRTDRRHGRVSPLLPEYIRGEAPLPKIKQAVTHGVTGGEDDLMSILSAGGALNIAERIRVHTQGKASTSKKGDVRSGIDHGLFCTIGSSHWGAIKLVLRDDVFLRRDLCLAPKDYGAAPSRYSHYANHHNKLRSEAGEASANLYVPLSAAARQQHINHHAGGSGNEFNPVNGVTLEDLEYIVVTSTAMQQKVEDKLKQLVADGAIQAVPQVVTSVPELKRS